MFSDLTVLIPTHERPKYLRRILDYYRGLDAPIMIADSSAEPFPANELPDNVDYTHYAGVDFYSKMTDFVGRCRTTYCVICPDDDFVVPAGISAALEFLKENRDYASAQGRQVSYVHGQKLDFSLIYLHSIAYELDADTPSGRFRQLMRLYVQQVYAVQYTETLQRAFPACRGIENKNFGELIFCSYAAFRGKHKVMPTFYCVREQPRGGLPVKSITEVLHLPEHQGDVDLYSKALVRELAIREGLTTDAALQVVAEALETYFDFDKSWRSGAYATLEDARDRTVRRWKDADNGAPIQKLYERFDVVEKLGNPSHDDSANAALQVVAQAILKHGVNAAA